MSTDLDERQVAAIQIGIELGRQIAIEYPEIGAQYRDGLTIRELIAGCFTDGDYPSRSYAVTETVFFHALNGYRGNVGFVKTEPYKGLLPRQECREIAARNREDWGNRAFQEGIGIFGMSPDESLKAVKRGRSRCRDMGAGIHSQTKEERIAASHKGVSSRGLDFGVMVKKLMLMDYRKILVIDTMVDQTLDVLIISQ